MPVVNRSQLARLALDAAAAVPGVVGVDAGPHGLWVTADPPTGVLVGVSVVAQADGCYAVDLCLVAGIVPLLELGNDVRRSVQARAGREGVADQVGSVNVQFERVLSDEEIREQARRAQEQVLAELAAEALATPTLRDPLSDPAPAPPDEEPLP